MHFCKGAIFAMVPQPTQTPAAGACPPPAVVGVHRLSFSRPDRAVWLVPFGWSSRVSASANTTHRELAVAYHPATGAKHDFHKSRQRISDICRQPPVTLAQGIDQPQVIDQPDCPDAAGRSAPREDQSP